MRPYLISVTIPVALILTTLGYWRYRRLFEVPESIPEWVVKEARQNGLM